MFEVGEYVENVIGHGFVKEGSVHLIVAIESPLKLYNTAVYCHDCSSFITEMLVILNLAWCVCAWKPFKGKDDIVRICEEVKENA